MLKLEDIKKNASLSGIEPRRVVRFVTTEPVGESALTVYYKTPDGKLLDRMLFRTDEANLSLAEARPWAFYAPGEDFNLAAEAYRMRRMVKKETLRFDGTHLFPERRAEAANYRPSCAEAALQRERLQMPLLPHQTTIGSFPQTAALAAAESLSVVPLIPNGWRAWRNHGS